MRGTLRALAGAQKSQVAAETVAALTGLTQRIDTRLGEVQAGVQGVQADIAAWQLRLDVRKSRLLFLFNLLALLMTLMLAWIVYSGSSSSGTTGAEPLAAERQAVQHHCLRAVLGVAFALSPPDPDHRRSV